MSTYLALLFRSLGINSPLIVALGFNLPLFDGLGFD